MHLGHFFVFLNSYLNYITEKTLLYIFKTSKLGPRKYHYAGSDVIDKTVEPYGDKGFQARVVLQDGRTGQGRSGDTLIRGTREKALSKAIADARSKPVPRR